MMFVVLRVSVRNDTSENELFYLLEVRHSTRGEKIKIKPQGFSYYSSLQKVKRGWEDKK